MERKKEVAHVSPVKKDQEFCFSGRFLAYILVTSIVSMETNREICCEKQAIVSNSL